MKKMVKSPEVRANIHKVANIIDRPLTILVVLIALIVYQGLVNAGIQQEIVRFQKENQVILRNQEKAREEARAESAGRDKAEGERTKELLLRIDRLENLNCGILLLHDPDLNDNLPQELVEVCENEIETRGTFDASGFEPSMQVQPESSPSSNKAESNAPQNGGPSNPPVTPDDNAIDLPILDINPVCLPFDLLCVK